MYGRRHCRRTRAGKTTRGLQSATSSLWISLRPEDMRGRVAEARATLCRGRHCFETALHIIWDLDQKTASWR